MLHNLYKPSNKWYNNNGYTKSRGRFMLKNKRQAFTVAEILIAMVAIGIVAAVTVPQLLGNTGARTNKVMIQKTFAAFAQSIRISETKLDYNTSEVEKIINTAAADISIENFLKKSMDITLKENISQHSFTGKLITVNSSGALTRASSESSTGVKLTQAASSGKRGGIFETRDGAYYMFPDKTDIATAACTKDSPCIMYVDINGPESPNRLVSCATDADTGIWKKDGFYYNGTTEKDASCAINENKISDVYPLVIYGGTAVPAINALNSILTSHE